MIKINTDSFSNMINFNNQDPDQDDQDNHQKGKDPDNIIISSTNKKSQQCTIQRSCFGNMRQIHSFYGSLHMRMNIHFIRNYLDADYADKLFGGLKRIKYNSDEESMVKIMGKSIKIPRKQASFGEPDTYYHFSGTSVMANNWNSEDSNINSRVARELKWVSKKAGKTAGATFNHTLVNNYLDQTNCIGYHSDDEKELGKYPVVVGISFGQEREIYFKSNITGDVIKISLPHNSFYVMHYPTNKFWKHTIPRSARQMSQRISLTFRSVG